MLKGGPADWNKPIWELDLDDGLRILRLAIDTHLITSHHLLPLLIDKPGGLLVEVTDGTAEHNASRYRISVFYDLAKVAVNRLAFSQGHELEPFGATAVAVTPGWLRSEMMLDAFGVSEENWRDVRHRPARLRALGIASIRRSRRRRVGIGSRPGEMEPAIGQLRSARARIRVHGCRRLAARHVAVHRGGPRARARRLPRRLPVIPPSRQPSAGRLWRLAEELEEIGLPKGGSEPFHEMLLEEIDYVLRPAVHEGRIVSSGTILEPAAEPDQWSTGTQLDIAARRWCISRSARRAASPTDFRAGSCAERTATTSGWCSTGPPAPNGTSWCCPALSMPRSSSDTPRARFESSGASASSVGSSSAWHYEPPLSTWIDSVTAPPFVGDRDVLEAMLEFAVHDLGSWGIGSLLVYRPGPEPGPAVEERLPTPPPLRIRAASHLGPLRHALAQVDGAAVFDGDGVSDSWACAWCRARPRSRTSTRSVVPATPPGAATASTTRPPPSSR